MALMGRLPSPIGAYCTAHIARDIYFVAEAEFQIIAFAGLTEKVDGWWLETISVNPAQQRRGAGLALITMREHFLTSCTDLCFLCE